MPNWCPLLSRTLTLTFCWIFGQATTWIAIVQLAKSRHEEIKKQTATRAPMACQVSHLLILLNIFLKGTEILRVGTSCPTVKHPSSWIFAAPKILNIRLTLVYARPNFWGGVFDHMELNKKKNRFEVQSFGGPSHWKGLFFLVQSPNLAIRHKAAVSTHVTCLSSLIAEQHEFSVYC